MMAVIDGSTSAKNPSYAECTVAAFIEGHKKLQLNLKVPRLRLQTRQILENYSCSTRGHLPGSTKVPVPKPAKVPKGKRLFREGAFFRWTSSADSPFFLKRDTALCPRFGYWQYESILTSTSTDGSGKSWIGVVPTHYKYVVCYYVANGKWL